MARPEFQDFINVRSTTAAPGPNSDPIIVENFMAKTFQVHSYQSGTYKIQGTVGDHDDWEDVPGCTGIAGNGLFSTALTLSKVRVVTTVNGNPPKVTFGGFNNRTDGA